jgi:uracil-DNA glycosylase family 4
MSALVFAHTFHLEKGKRAMSLNEIYQEYQNLGLGGKNGTSQKLVPGYGPVPAKLMIVGEAPGADEDLIGKPFQGSAGRVLDRLLGFCDVKREDVFITNTFKYRPPNNRDPLPEEVRLSLPVLSAEIKLVDPLLVILAGKIAVSTVFPTRTIRSLRGKIIKKGNRHVLCTYHPAATLHSPRPTIEADLRSDFKLAANFINLEGIDYGGS